MAANSNYILYGTDALVSINGTDIGYTTGDITIEMAAEEYYPDLSRARGPVSGTGRIVGATGKITCTLAEWQYATLSTMYSIGYNTVTSDTIGSGSLGTIVELTNITITGAVRNDTKAFRVTMFNGRVTTPVATALAEANESGIEVTFEAIYTDAAPKTYPMMIEFAK